jgi:hypothetical protein
MSREWSDSRRRDDRHWDDPWVSLPPSEEELDPQFTDWETRFQSRLRRRLGWLWRPLRCVLLAALPVLFLSAAAAVTYPNSDVPMYILAIIGFLYAAIALPVTVFGLVWLLVIVAYRLTILIVGLLLLLFGGASPGGSEFIKDVYPGKADLRDRWMDDL